MKLFRNLIYSLLGLLVISIALVCIVCRTSVMSRIATGLVTGSFVGLLSAIVNYVYARESFFEKLSLGLIKISSKLESDYWNVKIRYLWLSSIINDTKMLSQKDAIEKESDQVVAMKSSYDVLLSEIGCGDFAGILPSDGKVSIALCDLNKHLNDNVGKLYEELDSCLQFSWFSQDVSEHARGHFLGNPDKSYDLLVRRNKEFPDLLAYDIDKLAKICSCIGDACKWAIPSSAKDAFRRIRKNAESLLNGMEVRDIRKERREEVERNNRIKKERGIPW